MDKFQNSYRIESARLKGWNYGWDAWYYVTICTGQRTCFFGEISNRKMKFSGIGLIAGKIWQEIPRQFPYALLDEYIIMPNHIHGIIRIKKNDIKQNPDGARETTGNDMRERIGDGTRDGIGDGTRDGRDAINRVSTNNHVPISDHVPTSDRVSAIDDATGNLPQNHPGGITGDFNPMLHDNLSRVIRWYKGRTTFEARKITPGFSWQSRFHDRILRDIEQLNVVRKYIINNPRNWKNNELYNP